MVGTATSQCLRGKGVVVLFPGNKRATHCYLTQARRLPPPTALRCPSCSLPPCAPHNDVLRDAGAQVSREPPPPLPGGYVVGDNLYFTGASETFQSGDRLEHGKQGEVTGPATSERTGGRGLAVKFPGNEGALDCCFTEARRLPPLSSLRCPSCPPPKPTTIFGVRAHR